MSEPTVSSRVGDFLGKVLAGCLILVGTLWGLRGCVTLDYATDGVDAHAEAIKSCDYWDRYWDGLLHLNEPGTDEQTVLSYGDIAYAAAQRAGVAEMRYKPLLAAFDRFADTVDDTDPSAGLSAAADISAACTTARTY